MKKLKQWHTSDKKKGMGDFTGRAVKQKVGSLRETPEFKNKTSKLKKPLNLS